MKTNKDLLRDISAFVYSLHVSCDLAAIDITPMHPFLTALP